jgi:hypothetical protein
MERMKFETPNITAASRRGGSRTAPTTLMKQKSIGGLIGAYKTVSTKQINVIRGMPGRPVWQRNYLECSHRK